MQSAIVTKRGNLRAAVAVVAAGAALAAAGCGAGELSKSEYEERVRVAWEDVRAAFRASATGGFEARVERGQDALRDGAEDLDDADAPKAVEEENEELVQALRGLADDFDAVREAAESGDSERIRSFYANLTRNRWLLQIQEIAEQMTAKGYNLGPIAED